MGFIILVVILAEGNAEQTSEDTWPGLVREACKAPDDSYRHFLKVISGPVSETAFRVLLQASIYLLKRQRQYESSVRSLCHPPPPTTLQNLLLIGMQHHPSHLFICLFIV